MSIYISNELYLDTLASGGVANRPLIGWSSVFNVNSISASSTSEFAFSASSIWSGDTYTYWRSTSSGLTSVERSVEFTNDDGGAINYVGIFGHNMSSDGISYKLQSSNNGVDWTDLPGSPGTAKIPSSDFPIMEFFDEITAPFFRLLFVVPAMAGGIALTHVKLGRVLQLERPRFVGDTPGGMDLRVDKIGSRSYSGQHLGSIIVSEGDAFNITQENNTGSFIRSDNLQYFLRHARQLEKLSNGPVETFFYAWRPDEFPEEVQYCGQTTSFNPPTNQHPNGLMQWSMQGDAFRRRIF